MEKDYTPEFKFQMVLQILKRQHTQKELEARYDIPPGTLAKWKAQFIENAPSIYQFVTYDTTKDIKNLSDTYMVRIRQLRQKNGYSQREIGQLLGTAQNMYARYENGRSQMSVRYLMKLALFYGVSMDYLAGLTEEGDES